MEITSIEKNRRKKGMLDVYIDGKQSFTITEEDFFALNLYEKGEIVEEEISYIKDTIRFKSAKSKAVRYISLKIRSERDVRLKLAAEGFNSQIIDRVVEELKSIGYINDMIFAQKHLYDRSKLKPSSKRLLRYELQNKGIAESIIDEVLAGWEIDESTVATRLIKRKFGKYNINDEKIIKKIFSFLQNRGFSDEVVNKALRMFKNDEE